MAIKPRYSTAALFFSFPATLIAEVLCVSKQTAYHLKSGCRRPGPLALKHWKLYVAGRILDEHWKGWSVRAGTLFDPDGNRVTQSQLIAYGFVWQLAWDLGQGDPTVIEALDSYARMAMNREDPWPVKRSARQLSADASRERVYAGIALRERARRSRNDGGAKHDAENDLPFGTLAKTPLSDQQG